MASRRPLLGLAMYHTTLHGQQAAVTRPGHVPHHTTWPAGGRYQAWPCTTPHYMASRRLLPGLAMYHTTLHGQQAAVTRPGHVPHHPTCPAGGRYRAWPCTAVTRPG